LKAIVKIEPAVQNLTSPEGVKSWREVFPDTNQYGLSKIRLFGDYRCTTPIVGYNTEVWLIEGEQPNIDRFVQDNPQTATLLTLPEVVTLRAQISPARSQKCPVCGSTVNISEPVIPLLV